MACTVPVIYVLSGLRSQAMSAAASSGLPSRLICQLPVAAAAPPPFSTPARFMGVSMGPLDQCQQWENVGNRATHGAIALTRMPRSPTLSEVSPISMSMQKNREHLLQLIWSARSPLKKSVLILPHSNRDCIPCLAAVYAACFGNPMIPAMLEAFTILPPSFIFWSSARMQYMTADVSSVHQCARRCTHLHGY